ncbi:hypothetical protein Tco_0414599 [Tanacetum coccineum]
MLGASGVQIPQNNLDNLRSTIEEEDGATEVLDPQDVPGSVLLEIIDFAILVTSRGMGSLRGTLLVAIILVKGHAFLTKVKVLPVGLQLYPILVNTFSCSCTFAFPDGSSTQIGLFKQDLTILEWSSTLFFFWVLLEICRILSFFVLSVDFDLLDLVDRLTLVEVETELLEVCLVFVWEEHTCFWDVLDDMTGSANLTVFFVDRRDNN